MKSEEMIKKIESACSRAGVKIVYIKIRKNYLFALSEDYNFVRWTKLNWLFQSDLDCAVIPYEQSIATSLLNKKDVNLTAAWWHGLGGEKIVALLNKNSLQPVS